MFDEIHKGKYWDKPWSLVSGCTRCSPGCDRCWALAMEKRFPNYSGKAVDASGWIRIHPERLGIPLKRKKRTVWGLWNDLAHEDVEFSFFEKVIFVVKQSPMHIFLFLTKRPEQQAVFFKGISNYTSIPKNLWPGVSVCNQAEADKKIPILLQIPAAVRFISIEPMLGPVDMNPWFGWTGKGSGLPSPLSAALESLKDIPGINWVIVGGESGPGARSMHPDWARSVRDQCQAAGIPFFFKRHGSHNERYYKGSRFDATNTGRLLDGRTWDQLPDFQKKI